MKSNTFNCHMIMCIHISKYDFKDSTIFLFMVENLPV